jgi:hypothetical protein
MCTLRGGEAVQLESSFWGYAKVDSPLCIKQPRSPLTHRLGGPCPFQQHKGPCVARCSQSLNLNGSPVASYFAAEHLYTFSQGALCLRWQRNASRWKGLRKSTRGNRVGASADDNASSNVGSADWKTETSSDGPVLPAENGVGDFQSGFIGTNSRENTDIKEHIVDTDSTAASAGSNGHPKSQVRSKHTQTIVSAAFVAIAH